MALAAAGVREGLSGVQPLNRFPGPSGIAWYSATAAPVDVARLLAKPKDAKLIGRSTALALAAAREALDGLPHRPATPPERIGIFAGSGQTGLEAAEFFRAIDVSRKPPVEDLATLGGRPSRGIDPYFSLRTLSNAAVHYVAELAGARGPSQNFVQGPAAGVQALDAGIGAIELGLCDVALVVCHDCLVLPSIYEMLAKEELLHQGDAKEGWAPGEAGAAVALIASGDAVGPRVSTVFGGTPKLPATTYVDQTGYLGAAQPLTDLILWLASRGDEPSATAHARSPAGIGAAIHVTR